jgi:hypothetical protein
MMRTAPPAYCPQKRGTTKAALAAAALFLAGCGDTHPLYGPNSPRDGAGRPVDPIYGTPLPGTPGGNGGI